MRIDLRAHDRAQQDESQRNGERSDSYGSMHHLSTSLYEGLSSLLPGANGEPRWCTRSLSRLDRKV